MVVVGLVVRQSVVYASIGTSCSDVLPICLV
jgi:hypothetical protein